MDTNLLLQLIQAAGHNKSSGIDSQTVLLILTALMPTLAALAAYLKARAVEAGVKEVHLSINSRLDGWLEHARASGRDDERKSVADKLMEAKEAKDVARETAKERKENKRGE